MIAQLEKNFPLRPRYIILPTFKNFKTAYHEATIDFVNVKFQTM